MHWLVVFLVVLFSLEALIQMAQAGGWKPKARAPLNRVISAIICALLAAGIAVWLG